MSKVGSQFCSCVPPWLAKDGHCSHPMCLSLKFEFRSGHLSVSVRVTSGENESIPCPLFSIRILINWRRKDPAVDASAEARADRARLTGRPGNSPRLIGRSGIAEARAPLDVLPMLLLCMFGAACLGLGRCDHRNYRQRRSVHGQRQEPDREFAHAPLRLGQFRTPPLRDAGLEFKVTH